MGLYWWDDTYVIRGRSPYPAGRITNGGTGRTLEGVLEEGPAIAPDDERIAVSSSGEVAPGMCLRARARRSIPASDRIHGV